MLDYVAKVSIIVLDYIAKVIIIYVVMQILKNMYLVENNDIKRARINHIIKMFATKILQVDL